MLMVVAPLEELEVVALFAAAVENLTVFPYVKSVPEAEIVYEATPIPVPPALTGAVQLMFTY
jgi:hypothetical protein